MDGGGKKGGRWDGRSWDNEGTERASKEGFRALEVDGTSPSRVLNRRLFPMCQGWSSSIYRKRRKQDENASGDLNHEKAR